MDSGVSAAVWNELRGAGPQVGWFAVIFTMTFPLELYFGSERKATWSERCGNFAAMSIHFLLGGVVLGLLLAAPFGRALTSYPQEPRAAWLHNP